MAAASWSGDCTRSATAGATAAGPAGGTPTAERRPGTEIGVPVFCVGAMTKKPHPAVRRAARTPRAARSGPCRHGLYYETDWLGRTYLGCPVCERWKLVKAKPATNGEPKRAAA